MLVKFDARGVFELPTSGATREPPTEFRLLKAGENDTDYGVILFDAKSAETAIATYKARGVPLMADYEHQSLSDPPVEAPASCREWVPEIRNGELWATACKWTDRAAAMIRAGEYRLFSIACRIEKKSGRVLQVLNFGLTNLPAAHGIEPLVAAVAAKTPIKEPDMRTVLVALGLRADAEETEALSVATSIREFEREVLALSGKASRAEALGVLRAHAQAQEQLVALNARVKQIETEKRAADFDQLVAKGAHEGKLSPALIKSEWITKLRTKDDGVEQLSAYLGSAPKLVATEEAKPPTTADGKTVVVQFTAEEKQVADAFGINLQDIAKFRAAKAEKGI